MERWSADRLREEFLRFFEEKGHKRLPSASLVPHGDPTLLLTAAGMVPFKPYFLGKAVPEYPRVTTCQRCVRTPDIDQVGLTDRHNTFFEMLGNFSFGDYFKRDAIVWAWEFVVERMGIPRERVWVSVYHEDDEAAKIWQDEVGIPQERIVRMGKADNFWEIGVGPCGPCSEIHIDRGLERGCGHDDCRPGCPRCERFVEIWNLVFIQFFKDEEGRYHPLERKGIDTGMGLERAAALLQGVDSNFEIDLVRPVLDEVAKRAGVAYKQNSKADVSLRVITDHMRAVTFLVFDGVMPGNEGRGYVLRRLLRRAVRHARLLGVEGPFLGEIVGTVVRQMKAGYPELIEREEYIRKVVDLEEQRFHQTLDQGLAILEQIIRDVERRGERVLAGSDLFRLYDTYGFPLELSREIAAERGLEVDEAGFAEAMAGQRERARAARDEDGYLGRDQKMTSGLEHLPGTDFVGYEQLETAARVLAILSGGSPVSEVGRGQDVEVVLDRTPFYPEGGGQVPDTGTITGADGQLEVKDVQRTGGGLVIHRGRMLSGRLAVGDAVLASVDAEARLATQRHHTATHLLHAALQEILGSHANQAGSLVAPSRLRFDFTHFAPVEPEQLAALERRVNQTIMADLPVSWTEMPLEEARRMGAKALFGEKYGDVVRVVRIGDYSLELCGGTHVRRSGELGMFKIVAETGVAAGVRRIEAVAGEPAWEYVAAQDRLVREMAGRLRTVPQEMPKHLDGVLADVRRLEKERESLRTQLLAVRAESLAARAETVGGARVVVTRVDNVGPDDLPVLGDQLRDRLGSGVVVLAAIVQGKVNLLAMATKDLVAEGVHAGRIVREAAEAVGGGGGGQPHLARAGGRSPEGLPEALERARHVIGEQLAATRKSG
ncbi:MAG: alanine--tRNA ligase [Firmicutes bacterium]|nr:alanine--tRNA ligase [Bacillota bacterium]